MLQSMSNSGTDVTRNFLILPLGGNCLATRKCLGITLNETCESQHGYDRIYTIYILFFSTYKGEMDSYSHEK